MKTTQLSALSRPVDISYRSNRSILLIILLTMIAGCLYQWFVGNPFLDSLWWGVQAGLLVFLGWALGRELDPDNNATAFVAVLPTLLVFYFFETANWLLLIEFLLLMRISSHVCGRTVRLTDAVLVIGLAAYLGWRGDYLIGFALTVAFVIDYRLRPANAHSLWYAVAASVLTVAAIVISPATVVYAFDFSYPWLGGLLLTVLLFIPVIWEYKRPRSTEDYRVQPLSGSRMQATQLIVLLSLVVMYLLKGRASVLALAPLWSVILSAGLLRIYQLLTHHRPS